MASSTALSTTSQTRWCRPVGPVDPMYIPGRFRTGSRPSRTVMSLGVVRRSSATSARPLFSAPQARPFQHRLTEREPAQRGCLRWRFAHSADDGAIPRFQCSSVAAGCASPDRWSAVGTAGLAADPDLQPGRAGQPRSRRPPGPADRPPAVGPGWPRPGGRRSPPGPRRRAGSAARGSAMAGPTISGQSANRRPRPSESCMPELPGSPHRARRRAAGARVPLMRIRRHQAGSGRCRSGPTVSAGLDRVHLGRRHLRRGAGGRWSGGSGRGGGRPAGPRDRNGSSSEKTSSSRSTGAEPSRSVASWWAASRRARARERCSPWEAWVRLGQPAERQLQLVPVRARSARHPRSRSFGRGCGQGVDAAVPSTSAGSRASTAVGARRPGGSSGPRCRGASCGDQGLAGLDQCGAGRVEPGVPHVEGGGHLGSSLRPAVRRRAAR